MKILILCLCLFLSLHTLADLKKEKLPEYSHLRAEENNSFFLTGKGFLILPYEFASQFMDKKEKWQKVPATEFLRFGIKQGSEIKYVNLKTGEMSSYKVGTHLNVVSIYSSMEEKDRAAYLLLKDDPKGVVVPGDGGADYYDGIAYTGNEYKIKSFSPSSKFPFEMKNLEVNNPEVKKIVAIHNKDFPDTFVADSANVTFLDKSEMYQIFGKTSGSNYPQPVSGNGLVLKTNNQYIEFGGWMPTDYSPATISFEVYKFLEGPDWVISVNEQGMHSCFDLIISKNGKIKRIPLYCDSGGC